MYTRHKGWPLRGVGVDIMHAKELGADAAAGDLSEEQRERLLAIANKCPVHRTLERASTVKTVLPNEKGAA